MQSEVPAPPPEEIQALQQMMLRQAALNAIAEDRQRAQQEAQPAQQAQQQVCHPPSQGWDAEARQACSTCPAGWTRGRCRYVGVLDQRQPLGRNDVGVSRRRAPVLVEPSATAWMPRDCIEKRDLGSGKVWP